MLNSLLFNISAEKTFIIHFLRALKEDRFCNKEIYLGGNDVNLSSMLS